MCNNERVMESKEFRRGVEKLFVEQMNKKGFEVVRSSMPGFVCYRNDGVIIFVAVKLAKSHKLSKEQRRFMNSIRANAIGTKTYCYKWSPDDDWTTREGLILRNDTKDKIPRKSQIGFCV